MYFLLKMVMFQPAMSCEGMLTVRGAMGRIKCSAAITSLDRHFDEVGTRMELVTNDDSWKIPTMNESMYTFPIKNVRFRDQPREFSGKLK